MLTQNAKRARARIEKNPIARSNLLLICIRGKTNEKPKITFWKVFVFFAVKYLKASRVIIHDFMVFRWRPPRTQYTLHTHTAQMHP